MLSLRQRLRKLERLPALQRPPDSVDPAIGLALMQISDEDLAVLDVVFTDHNAGVKSAALSEGIGRGGGLRNGLSKVKDGSTVVNWPDHPSPCGSASETCAAARSS
jgi:hypothetical protein